MVLCVLNRCSMLDLVVSGEFDFFDKFFETWIKGPNGGMRTPGSGAKTGWRRI